MKSEITLLLADDLPMFLDGLHLLLQKEPRLNILGKAKNGIELLSLVEKSKPDVVITDIQMSLMNGIEVTSKIRMHYPSIGVIALTQYEEDYLIVEMLEAGAQGYILKTNPISDLVEAIEAVYSGE